MAGLWEYTLWCFSLDPRGGIRSFQRRPKAGDAHVVASFTWKEVCAQLVREKEEDEDEDEDEDDLIVLMTD